MTAGVLVYGATGVTGRACVAELERAGVRYTVAGRNERSLHEAAGPACLGVRVAEVDALEHALDDVGCLLSTAGPFVRHGEAVLTAAIRAGVPYVDTTAEQSFVALARRHDADAQAAGVAAVPACGVEYLPMLLGAALLGPGPVDTWLWLDDFVPTPGSVRSMVAMAGQGTTPRPRRHASGDRVGWHVQIPGVESVLVHPACRTHLMLGRWEAWPFRLLWPLARRLDLVRLADSLADRLPTPDATARAHARFTVIVSQGERALRFDGVDVYASTARYAVAVASALADGRARSTGVRSVAEVLDPHQLLALTGLVATPCPVPSP